MVSDQQLSIDVLLDRISPDNAQPLRQKQTPPTIDNEQTAQQWVANRPEQTSVQAAIDLYQALPQIIDLDIDASSKLAIFEAIYPQLIQCTDRLLNTQLNQNTAKAVSLGQALIRQIYRGYKSLVIKLGREEHSDGEQLSQSILRSCQLLAQIQRNSLTHYMARPNYFWRDLHGLYLLACELQIQHQKNHCSENSGSIHNIYLKLLLINCTRPNHFSNYELNYIYTELDFWASMTDLHRGSRGGLFVVDTSSNQGPVYSDNTALKPENFILDTFNLVKFLNNSLLEKSNHNLFSDRISRRVLVDLARQWGEKIMRRETHILDRARVNLACGLNSAVCMLAATESFDAFLELCGQPANKQPLTVDRTPKSLAGSNLDDPVLFAGPYKKTSKINPLQGLRINTSLNGACVELMKDQTAMQPGKTIALQTSTSQRWTAGIVRWKQITPSLNVICGIQFPAKYSAAVAIRSFKRSDNTNGDFMQAVILSSNADFTQETSLLCPALRYQRGGKIQLLTASHQYSAILLEELETTEHLSHFKIAIY